MPHRDPTPNELPQMTSKAIIPQHNPQGAQAASPQAVSSEGDSAQTGSPQAGPAKPNGSGPVAPQAASARAARSQTAPAQAAPAQAVRAQGPASHTAASQTVRPQAAHPQAAHPQPAHPQPTHPQAVPSPAIPSPTIASPGSLAATLGPNVWVANPAVADVVAGEGQTAPIPAAADSLGAVGGGSPRRELVSESISASHLAAAHQRHAERSAGRIAPPRPRRTWVGVVVQLILIAGMAGAGYYAYSKNLLTKEAIANLFRHGDPPVAPPKRVTPVVTSVVRRGNMDLVLNGLGSVTAMYTVTLHCRVDGELQKIHFIEGQMVKQGDLLGEIDPRPFQVQLEQAEGALMRDRAALKVAKLDLDRFSQMIASKSITQSQYDGQVALVQQSEGAIRTDVGLIENAKLQMRYCNITAPISGRIGLRMVDPGNIVHASDMTGLAVITQLQPITVVFTIPQDDIGRVQRQVNTGAKLAVSAYDRDMTTWLADGELMALDNQVDVSTGTVKLKAIFPNADNMLFPNQFVNARLRLDVRRDAILAPTAAVQRGPDSTFSYIVQSKEMDGRKVETVALRKVVVGPVEGEQCVIESGLEAGDVVVIDGVDKLQPGAVVMGRDRSATSKNRGVAEGSGGAGSPDGAGSPGGANSHSANRPARPAGESGAHSGGEHVADAQRPADAEHVVDAEDADKQHPAAERASRAAEHAARPGAEPVSRPAAQRAAAQSGEHAPEQAAGRQGARRAE